MTISTDKTELRKALDQLWPYLATCLGISSFMSVLYLAPIGYMRDVYGPVINSRSIENLLWVTLLLVVLLITTALLDWIRQKILLAASIKFAAALSLRIFDATFRADLLKIQGARIGLSDLRVVRNFISSPTMGIACDAPFGLIFLVLVFAIHPAMGYLASLGALLALILGVWTERRVRPLMSKAIENANQANTFIMDSGRNAQVIQAMGMIGAIRKNWLLIQNRFLAQQARASNEQAIGTATSRVVMLVQGSALLGLGTLFTLIGQLPPSAGAYLIVAKLLGAMAVRPTMQLITGWKQIATALESYKRLDRFLDKLPKPTPSMSLPAPQGYLEVIEAAVRPPNTKTTVVSEMSFKLSPGHFLAVIGPSGSGKSSLARLLVGVWRPLLGSVRLDGAEVSTWDKSELGPHIGYLPQAVELFDGTIAQNIARFGEINSVYLDRALRLSGLEPLIKTLPDGVETPIGSDGARLSGGQRQRVGIARAIYGDPKLIVMDEPNSSLDEIGEDVLANTILEMRKKNATIVVISHKKNILKSCDLILVMMSGKPKLFGTKDQVLKELMKKAA